MIQPPSPPRRPRPVAGTAARAAGARRARTGGRVAGTAYAPPAPAEAGDGGRWPHRDFSAVEPGPLREAYESWQAICRDVAPRRRARWWEQTDLATAAGIAVNTVQRIERGQWVAAHNLLMVCSALGLQIEQTVDVADVTARRSAADREARRSLARPAASDRVATREEVLAGRAVIAALARHHNLLEPRVDLDGTVYMRSGGSGFGPLWRFAAAVAQTLDVWVNVSPDQAEAIRTEADPL